MPPDSHPQGHPVDVTDADGVAGLVRAVAGVAGLHPGRFGEVATYLPGRRVAGVSIGDDRIDVHVRVSLAAPVREVAARVRAAVAAAYPNRIVDVTVEDVEDVEDTEGIKGMKGIKGMGGVGGTERIGDAGNARNAAAGPLRST